MKYNSEMEMGFTVVYIKRPRDSFDESITGVMDRMKKDETFLNIFPPNTEFEWYDPDIIDDAVYYSVTAKFSAELEEGELAENTVQRPIEIAIAKRLEEDRKAHGLSDNIQYETEYFTYES